MRAEILHAVHVVGNEEDRPAFESRLAQSRQALLPEGEVPDGEDLVQKENLRVEVRRDGERQPTCIPLE